MINCNDPVLAGSNDPAPKNYPYDQVGPQMVAQVSQV